MSIFSDVRTVLDESGGGVFWVDAEVVDSINEAQLNLAADVDPTLISTTLVLSSGVDLVAMPASIMIPNVIETGTMKIYPTTYAKLEQLSANWRAAPMDTPTHVVMYDTETFRFYPKPSRPLVWTLWGTPWPTEVSTTVDIDSASNTLFRRALADASAALLLELTQPLLAQNLSRESDEYITRFKRQLRNNQSHAIVRFRPSPNLPQMKNSGVVNFPRGF